MVGGMADFRLDSIALSLYGIFICLVIRSKVFYLGRWSFAAAAAVAMLILFRFQTALTLASVLGTLLCALCLMAFRGKSENRAFAIKRIAGLLKSGMVVVVLVSPVLWLSRRELLGYYLGEVAKNNDKIRAVEFGADGPLQHWTFYLGSLIIRSPRVALCRYQFADITQLICSWAVRTTENRRRPKLGRPNVRDVFGDRSYSTPCGSYGIPGAESDCCQRVGGARSRIGNGRRARSVF